MNEFQRLVVDKTINSLLFILERILVTFISKRKGSLIILYNY